MTESPIRATGIAWFRREDYDRCMKLFVDADKLPKTYEDWHRAAQSIYDSVTATGHLLVKAYIDPDAFPIWCATRGLDINAKARIAFANDTVRRAYHNQD